MRIAVDLDNTILDTSTMIINLYNKLYDKNIKINYKDLKWDFQPYISKEELPKVLKLFVNEHLYDEPIVFPNAIKTIQKLCDERHKVIICSKHSEERKPHTTKFIQSILPDVKIFYTDTFNKSYIGHVDVAIDDKIECLDSIDADLKILYGSYNWNKNIKNTKDYVRAEDWTCVLLYMVLTETIIESIGGK